jgi:hypothetical protein
MPPHPDCDGAFGHMVAVVSRAAMPPETPHPPWLNGISAI